ncbi:MAG TPA: NRDE family protein [Candidatus Eisenbacteria bacterium]|jgi:hypothetical protein
MCTLIIGRDVLGEGTMILAANRDEDPRRPTDPPGVLSQHPRVIGGRDRLAGGTWLAVRERRAVVAMLNRRDQSGEPAARAEDRRSRGLLAIDVAKVQNHGGGPEKGGMAASATAYAATLSELALDHAIHAVARDRYAPFSLVFASPASCWWLAHEGAGPPRHAGVPSGWHVLTHMDLDDPREPRTARLIGELDGFRPRSLDQALDRVGELLRSHGASEPPAPPVCLHEGRMVTVSASLVWLTEGQARYLHAEGRPCENPFADHSQLLGGHVPAADTR